MRLDPLRIQVESLLSLRTIDLRSLNFGRTSRTCLCLNLISSRLSARLSTLVVFCPSPVTHTITWGEIKGGQIQLKLSKSTTWRKNCLYRSDLSMRLCDMILLFRISSNQNLSDYILFVLILIYLY